MKKIFKAYTGIKRKVTAGFLLLLTLILVSVYSVIKLSSELSPSDPALSTSVEKLTITSNLLSSIIQSDGHARAYLNTGDSSYLEKYYEADRVTRKLIDSLEYSSLSNTNQFLRIVTVDSLLDLKRATFSNFFHLKQRITGKKQSELIRIIPEYSDSVKVSGRTISKTITEQYPLQPVKKQGFFGRLWSGITGKKQDDSVRLKEPVLDVRYDTILTYKAVQDTTLNQFKSQLRRLEARESKLRQQATEREMMLIQADQDIMNEIRAILLLYEKEEVSEAIAAAEKSQHVLKSLWETALILAGMGILTTIGFLIMIWKDLARSNYYRRQLEEARLLAEELLKVKEQFLANMSHEIRTPLTSIIGFSERLSETKINSEQSRYLKYITSSSEHLLELINDLLDFSRIGSGRLSLESKTFDPAELFDEAFEALTPKAEVKDLDLILKQNIPDVHLVGDPLRLRQIVINLLNNSIKFTDRGKVMLQTKVQLSPDGKQAAVTIRVADTGIGIPSDKLSLIFEEFSQVDHSITRKYGGSGLGLAITRKLVEMMNGTINVLSRKDQGTIFTVKLKMPVSEMVPEAAEESAFNRDLSGIHILLAEDDNTTRILIREMLEKYNAPVTCASDGYEAYSLFDKDPSLYKVIITDIQMPGLSGAELAERIRSTSHERKYADPVIIGLTAHADNNDISRFMKAGMDHVLLKPFRNHDLLKVLKVREQGSEDLTELPVDDVAGDDSLDLSRFRQFAGDDEDSLNRIIASLELNIARTSDEMVSSFRSRNYAELSLLAHRMIPNIKLLGAKEVTEHLRSIEVLCNQATVDEAALGKSFSYSITQLDRIRKKLTNTNLSST